jgi:predicted O-methyltransferase YrrM
MIAALRNPKRAVRRVLASVMPVQLSRAFDVGRECVRLARAPRASVDALPLTRSITAHSLAELLSDPKLGEEWAEVARDLAVLGITGCADGINQGDRRALYYLVRKLAPASVLEVGTHIGASTVYIATALGKSAHPSSRLVTVDITDVNDPIKKPWQQFGARMCPRELIACIDMESTVEFVTRPSLAYLQTCSEQFDFIFLDGDHAAASVYREIPAGLRLLRPGGSILLHDYFPELRPLWPDGKVLPGSWMAVQKLRAEGAALDALPLGDLPWPTKQGTRRTSLALVVGADQRCWRSHDTVASTP